MRAFARAGAAGCGILLLALAADYFLQPQDVPLLVLATAAALAVVACAIWALWPLRKVPTDRQVARFVEEHCPELEDRLVSATQLPPSGATSVFHDLVLADAASRTRTLDLGRVVSPHALRHSVLRGATSAVTLLIVLAIGLGPASRVARVAWLYAFPFTVSMEVTPGDAKVMSGQPLRIQARLGGSIGAPARSLPALTMITADGERTLEMHPADGGYRFDLASVTTSFKYRITAGTVSSEDYAVTALTVPHVKQIDIEYRYPAFTGLSPRVEADSGDIFAPAGTRVTLRVRSDKPVESGALVMDDGTRMTLARRGERELETSFEVEADGAYRVALVDPDGLSNPGETDYFVRTTLDRPPEIQITRPAGDREITPLEEMVVEARADDDYGVERFELVYSVVGGPERAIPLDRSGRAPTRSGSHTIFTEDLKVRPGDFIAYYARARDVGRGKQSTEARSDLFFLEVRPFDQEFEAMQSQGAMAQDAADVGNLASVEKEIIAATWKMDPRASTGSARPELVEGRQAGGERAGDIRAIARAQGELKETTAKIAERVVARGRTLTPENRGRRSPEHEAMSKAVEAMDRAESTLEALKTTESLPHEMEALNQLLKAQAEIRRKQVAMQQGNQGSSAGMNRATEDLSQLFDRELRKDQQTNYETRASQEQQENQESEALKKVRELADRQEALKREQEKLAEQAMAEEELKRNLDRLAREQNELRRQLEDLSKQLAAMRPGQQGQGQTGNQRQQTSEIADEMRRAMNELRRQDLGRASQRSSDALERLRDLERQLDSSPNERQQALGELQLEARQLAGAERRLASETREAQAGNGGRDTRRRLATEEDQLADRVDTLEHRIEDLLPRAGAEERAPLEAAREDLGREAIGSAMRQLADRLRQTLARERAEDAPRELAQIAQADERLAGVLDRVARRLGAASEGAEERRLSDELRQAQQLRQRLQELEQKIEQSQSGDAGNQPPSPDVDPSNAQDNKRGGQVVQAGADPQLSSEGRPDRMRPNGSMSGVGELARLQEEFLRELQETPELVEQLRQQNPAIRQNLEDWAKQWMVTSAPGTEAFKQDFSSWESLRRDIRLALEQFEASRAQQLTERETQDRVNAGSDERLPEHYRRLVEKYYQSLVTRPGR